jgi:hypothetical protein
MVPRAQERDPTLRRYYTDRYGTPTMLPREHDVAAIDDLSVNGMLGVRVGAQPVLLTRDHAEVYAVGGTCLARKHESNEATPRSLSRILSSRQFWDHMEKWRIPGASSLELIEFAGKLGKNGKRPRFRFTTRQQRITSYLPEIDAALAARLQRSELAPSADRDGSIYAQVACPTHARARGGRNVRRAAAT